MLRRNFTQCQSPLHASLEQLKSKVPSAASISFQIDRRQLGQVVAPIVNMASSVASSTTSGFATVVSNFPQPKSSSRKPLCEEWPTENMTLQELLELRRMCLASSAAYTLARQGAAAVEEFVANKIPGFDVDLSLSNDDHVMLVNHHERIAYLSCRGTCGKHPERKSRDVKCYLAILCTHLNVDPKDDVRIRGTLAAARKAMQLYHVEQRYAFRCVGHSLGGFAATICAQELDCSATNFNGPVYRPYGTQQKVAAATPTGAANNTTATAAAAETEAKPEPHSGSNPSTAVPGMAEASRIAAAFERAVPAVPSLFPCSVAERKGHVHHVQLGNDVVSLVGGAQPSECEKYTKLRYDGSQYDVAGAHYRDNIMAALEREIRRAAAAEGVDAATVLPHWVRVRITAPIVSTDFDPSR